MLRLYVAGRVQIEGPDRVVDSQDLAGRQGRIMLVRLALSRAPVGHEELADMLWPEDRPEHWRSTISPLASRLRSALDRSGVDGKSLLVGRHGAYELVLSERWVDVEVAIRSLDRAEGSVARGDHRSAWTDAAVASSVFRRPFLPTEDHPWIARWRAIMDDGMVRSLHCLAEAWLALGNWTLAEQTADEAIRLDPLREEAHRQRMRAMAGGGNAARAVRAFRELEELLAGELGATPSPETQEVFESLL